MYFIIATRKGSVPIRHLEDDFTYFRHFARRLLSLH